jgi:hypothetical protein
MHRIGRKILLGMKGTIIEYRKGDRRGLGEVVATSEVK